MKITKAGYQVIPEGDSITKKIERIARVCYKSEELIGEGTDLKMLNKLVERKHYAMLEHSSLAYIVPKQVYDRVQSTYLDAMTYRLDSEFIDGIPNTIRLKFTNTVVNGVSRYVVSANIRAWLEYFDWCAKCNLFSCYHKPIVEDLKLSTNGVVDFSEYTEGYLEYDLLGFHISIEKVTDYSILTGSERMIHENISVLFTVDRGVTHELVRMRDCSFAQESTRYCNYSMGKYGNEITVIEPCFFEKGSLNYNIWESCCEFAESQYILLTETNKVPAQQARDILPTSVKADIVVTTNLQEWRHIFKLRACDLTGPAHPQMKEVMCPLCKDMQKAYNFAFGDLVVAD